MDAAETHEHLRTIWQQHVELNKITARLVRMTQHGFDWYELDLELTRLDRMLVRHFELEEVGEYLREVRERVPGEAPLIRRLGEAHVQLRESLRHLRHLAVDKENMTGVRELLADWLDVLGKHEAAENQLVKLAIQTRPVVR